MVADEFAHVGPVLLFDVSAVVGVVGAGSGEGDFVRRAVVEQVVVGELGPVVAVVPMIGNGNTRRTCMSASNTPFSALFLTDRFTVHPVAMSVTVRVKQ